MWNISAKAGFAATNVSPVTHGWWWGGGQFPILKFYLSFIGTLPVSCCPGFRLEEECSAPRARSNCTPCPSGLYIDTINYAHNCKKCRSCKSTAPRFLPRLLQSPLLASQWLNTAVFSSSSSSSLFSATPEHDVLVSPCERHRNAVCRCEDGYYRSNIDSGTYECLKCRRCGPNEKEGQKCESGSSPEPVEEARRGVIVVLSCAQVRRRRTRCANVNTTTTDTTTSVNLAASA